MGTHYRGDPREVRALDAFIKLTRASHCISNQLNTHLAAEGLTAGQLGVLEALLHLGPLGQSELAAKLLTSPSNMTTVLDNLERRGLVRRERGVEDRRCVTVHLSPEGGEVIRQIFPRHLQRIVEAMETLDPGELDSLGQLCRKLGRAVAARAAE